MANIIKILEREVEKGNRLVDSKGNLYSFEKVEVMSQKAYVSDLKNGTIPFDKTFKDYHNDILEEYVTIPCIISNLKDFIKYGNEQPDLNTPQKEETM